MGTHPEISELILNTYSQALKYLETLKQLIGIWFRWLSKLKNYDLEVRHKPWKDNTNADNLSQCEHLPPPTKEEAKEAEEEATGKIV